MVNWVQRLSEDKEKLDDEARLKILRATLSCTSPFLTREEMDIFLGPLENLSNPDTLIAYSNIERRVGLAYSGGFEERWDQQGYVGVLREVLSVLYSSSELDDLERLILHPRDVSALSATLVFSHPGFRRVRNAYLPQSVDYIQIDPETGSGKNLTKELFKEGSEDAASRIDRILGKE